MMSLVLQSEVINLVVQLIIKWITYAYKVITKHVKYRQSIEHTLSCISQYLVIIKISSAM